MRIGELGRHIFKSIKAELQLRLFCPLAGFEGRLKAVPENEEVRIKKYFRSRCAHRYLKPYANEQISKVVIQIGMDKTASSSIQEFLENNQPLLHEHSVEFKTDWGGNNHSAPLKSMFGLRPEKIFYHMSSGNTKEEIDAYNEHNLLALCRGIRDSKQKTFIFFGEGICSFSRREYRFFNDFLSALMPNAEIRIMHCVRSNIGYASSAYQQAIKVGRYHEDGVRRYSNLYKHRIQNALKTFGRQRMEVYAYEETIKHPYGPVGYFLDAIGVSTDGLRTEDLARKNESISFFAVEIIEYINRKEPMITKGKRNPRRSRDDTAAILQIKGPKYQISKEVSRKIMQRAGDDIRWLNKNFAIGYSTSDQGPLDIQAEYDQSYLDACVKAFDQLNAGLKAEFSNYVG